MDCLINAVFARENDSTLLRSHALLKTLPEGFKLRSHAHLTINVDPGLPYEKALEVIGIKSMIVESMNGEGRQLAAFLDGMDGPVGLVDFNPGLINLDVISPEADAGIIIKKVEEALAPYKFHNKEESGVWVDFSYAVPNGVSRNTQFIHCPTWEEIRKNYTLGTRHGLDRLMDMEAPWESGRLMIWHGETGTGKTYSVRALMMAWRERFNFLVVTDPERLAADPAYYYQVASAPVCNLMPQVGKPPGEQPRKRLLFIFEDSADLIITDSRSKHYDKINKLLNITDGLIGQGREDVFLVTFNEAIKDIDPAFLRPGRCVADVEFGKFKEDAAREWLAAHGAEHCAACNGKMSLAELYAKVLDKDSPESRTSAGVGFGAAKD